MEARSGGLGNCHKAKRAVLRGLLAQQLGVTVRKDYDDALTASS